MKIKGPDFKKYEALGAQLIAYEIAMTALLDVLAKTQPSTARAVGKAIRDSARQVDQKKYGAVVKKALLYADMIDTTLKQNPQ
ncbi:MAG TPA: hypothetical protein VK663_09705 [Burkholderiales bacterium]|nr:hypothetical protein [Burkholderiales bacterium]